MIKTWPRSPARHQPVQGLSPAEARPRRPSGAPEGAQPGTGVGAARGAWGALQGFATARADCRRRVSSARRHRRGLPRRVQRPPLPDSAPRPARGAAVQAAAAGRPRRPASRRLTVRRQYPAPAAAVRTPARIGRYRLRALRRGRGRSLPPVPGGASRRLDAHRHAPWSGALLTESRPGRQPSPQLRRPL